MSKPSEYAVEDRGYYRETKCIDNGLVQATVWNSDGEAVLSEQHRSNWEARRAVKSYIARHTPPASH